MSELTPAQEEVARLIVETLDLEDVRPTDIDPDAALFRDGLGLDSIDALELAMSISKRYGVKLRSDDPDNARIFASLRSLTEYIEAQRAGA